MPVHLGPVLLPQVLFVTTLMFVDVRRQFRRVAALWIPVLWLTITGSRFVSQWITLGQTLPVNYTDGSAIDAIVFLTLISRESSFSRDARWH